MSVQNAFRKSKKGNDFDEVEILGDDSSASVGEHDTSFVLSDPKYAYKLPSKIAKMLYPHQREGLKWLWSLHCQGKGGILGDDMGLGKTMQVSLLGELISFLLLFVFSRTDILPNSGFGTEVLKNLGIPYHSGSHVLSILYSALFDK